jgi:predicted GIY-YIG superfamily endonuclease
VRDLLLNLQNTNLKFEEDFEIFDEVEEAIFREKQIKGYSRAKKVALINQFNNEWDQLPFDGKRKTITQKRSIE